MSAYKQRPEQLIIRDYIETLRAKKVITQEGLRDAFIPVYIDMIPPGDDVPTFEPVHRHDTPDQARKKDVANLKKLWRAIEGETYFPLCFKEPVLYALEKISKGLGVTLQKLLLHNAGLLHIPINLDATSEVVYAEFLKEFSDANAAMVEDYGDDGVLNNPNTREQVLESMEKHIVVLHTYDKNAEAK